VTDVKRPTKAEARDLRKAAKKAKTSVRPTSEKRPIPGPPVPDDQDALIMFRLGRLDHEGPWSWAEVSSDHIKLVAATCGGFETLRRGEFMNRPGNKPIPMENLCQEARGRLVELELDLFDDLWELRLGGEERIWGLLDGHVFYLVWWDPEHQVCPSTKKHT
jgi:hypothetical protein